MDDAPDRWFLDREERGNASTVVHAGRDGSPPWPEGNLVRPLVRGATYFARLREELTALRAGDRVWFTDWRGPVIGLVGATTLLLVSAAQLFGVVPQYSTGAALPALPVFVWEVSLAVFLLVRGLRPGVLERESAAVPTAV